MQRDAAGDGRHAEFAHAIVDVVATVLGGKCLGAAPVGEIGASQVCRTADHFRQVRGEFFNGELRGFAGGNRFGFVVGGVDGLARDIGKVGG